MKKNDKIYIMDLMNFEPIEVIYKETLVNNQILIYLEKYNKFNVVNSLSIISSEEYNKFLEDKYLDIKNKTIEFIKYNQIEINTFERILNDLKKANA